MGCAKNECMRGAAEKDSTGACNIPPSGLALDEVMWCGLEMVFENTLQLFFSAGVSSVCFCQMQNGFSTEAHLCGP